MPSWGGETYFFLEQPSAPLYLQLIDNKAMEVPLFSVWVFSSIFVCYCDIYSCC